MSGTQERFARQARWNDMGSSRMAALQETPERFHVTRSPHEHRMANADLLRTLGDVSGKRILELGCASGEFSVYLAARGATVVGVDIGPSLVAAAREVARANNVQCTFHTSSITNLPFSEGEFDTLVGVAVLHHLLPDDLIRALGECHRVLKPGGQAIFVEPVENSKIFNFIQNLFPAGRGEGERRPSILQRRAWTRYQEGMDDRPLTNREIIAAGSAFHSTSLRSYGLLVRLHRLLGRRTRKYLVVLDNALLAAFPPLRHLCKTVLVEYQA